MSVTIAFCAALVNGLIHKLWAYVWPATYVGRWFGLTDMKDCSRFRGLFNDNANNTANLSMSFKFVCVNFPCVCVSKLCVLIKFSDPTLIHTLRKLHSTLGSRLEKDNFDKVPHHHAVRFEFWQQHSNSCRRFWLSDS